MEANEALRRANADLQQFAYSASHDLQEPLRMVATYSELLKKRFGGELGEEGDEFISFTVEGAMRMQELLKDLRLYIQISTENQQPAAAVDANAVLRKTLQNLDLAIRESGASVTYAALPHLVMFEFQLEQLFQNLIANAIRYRSAEPPRIHVAARLHEGAWLFSVADNGIGIEAKFQEQIFGIFKRLHTATEHPGTGMGLAICHRIVQRSGGRIWVESEPGRGSTFYFTVPCPEPPARSELSGILHHSGGGQ
jgi:light-regulated signal transduction histidine kinase (bacteriophytochrome)